MSKVIFVLFAVLAVGFSQTARWVYCYNGPENGSDEASSLVRGLDGNIYAAGFSEGSGTGIDFTVISLTPEGAERWVYRYNGPGNSYDRASYVVYGADGNIYAAGRSDSIGVADLTVVSLTPEGAERWVYRYRPPGGSCQAGALAYGADGNIYVAGVISASLDDFTVISLTSDGAERWVYRYETEPGGANALVYGADDNIYAAGWIEASAPGGDDFAVISLTPTGAERWVYRGQKGVATSLVHGADDNTYAAGITGGGGDFTVVSLTPTGAEQWVYRYNGPGNSVDWARCVVYGADGNIYAAGDSKQGSGNDQWDITVISLTPDSAREPPVLLRWVYLYNGPADARDESQSVVYGADDNIYAAGRSVGIGTSGDFTVVSLTPDGAERWVYRWKGPANEYDEAYSLVYGSDGNIYAAGKSRNSDLTYDFVVISLDPGVGVDEASRFAQGRMFNLVVQPNPAKTHVAIRYTLDAPCQTLLQLCDLSGRIVRTLVNSQQKPGRYSIHWHGEDDRGRLLAKGVYFCRLRAGDYEAIEKLVLRH